MRFPTTRYVRLAKPQIRLRIRLCQSLEYFITVNILTEHHLEFLSLKEDCIGLSESTLVIMPYCWKSHVGVHITELFQHNLINVSYLTACYLYQVMMTLHFLNDVANDAESTQKSKNYTIIASLKSVQQWVN